MKKAVAYEAVSVSIFWKRPSYSSSALSSGWLVKTSVISSDWVYATSQWKRSTSAIIVLTISSDSLSSYGRLRPLVNVWKLLPSRRTTIGWPLNALREVDSASYAFMRSPMAVLSVRSVIPSPCSRVRP